MLSFLSYSLVLTNDESILVPNVRSYRHHSASKITQGSLVLRCTSTVKHVLAIFVYTLDTSASIQAWTACAQPGVAYVFVPYVMAPFSGWARIGNTCSWITAPLYSCGIIQNRFSMLYQVSKHMYFPLNFLQFSSSAKPNTAKFQIDMRFSLALTTISSEVVSGYWTLPIIYFLTCCKRNGKVFRSIVMQLVTMETDIINAPCEVLLQLCWYVSSLSFPWWTLHGDTPEVCTNRIQEE